MDFPEMTQREFEIVAHSIGIHALTMKQSKKKSDKKLPDEFYRNRFVAGEGHTDMPILRSLEEKGYMKQGNNNISDSLFFFVTEVGEFKFRKKFQEFINS